MDLHDWLKASPSSPLLPSSISSSSDNNIDSDSSHTRNNDSSNNDINDSEGTSKRSSSHGASAATRMAHAGACESRISEAETREQEGESSSGIRVSGGRIESGHGSDEQARNYCRRGLAVDQASPGKPQQAACSTGSSGDAPAPRLQAEGAGGTGIGGDAGRERSGGSVDGGMDATGAPKEASCDQPSSPAPITTRVSQLGGRAARGEGPETRSGEKEEGGMDVMMRSHSASPGKGGSFQEGEGSPEWKPARRKQSPKPGVKPVVKPAHTSAMASVASASQGGDNLVKASQRRQVQAQQQGKGQGQGQGQGKELGQQGSGQQQENRALQGQQKVQQEKMKEQSLGQGRTGGAWIQEEKGGQKAVSPTVKEASPTERLQDRAHGRGERGSGEGMKSVQEPDSQHNLPWSEREGKELEEAGSGGGRTRGEEGEKQSDKGPWQGLRGDAQAVSGSAMAPASSVVQAVPAAAMVEASAAAQHTDTAASLFMDATLPGGHGSALDTSAAATSAVGEAHQVSTADEGARDSTGWVLQQRRGQGLRGKPVAATTPASLFHAALPPAGYPSSSFHQQQLQQHQHQQQHNQQQQQQQQQSGAHVRVALQPQGQAQSRAQQQAQTQAQAPLYGHLQVDMAVQLSGPHTGGAATHVPYQQQQQQPRYRGVDGKAENAVATFPVASPLLYGQRGNPLTYFPQEGVMVGASASATGGQGGGGGGGGRGHRMEAAGLTALSAGAAQTVSVPGATRSLPLPSDLIPPPSPEPYVRRHGAVRESPADASVYHLPAGLEGMTAGASTAALHGNGGVLSLSVDGAATAGEGDVSSGGGSKERLHGGVNGGREGGGAPSRMRAGLVEGNEGENEDENGMATVPSGLFPWSMHAGHGFVARCNPPDSAPSPSPSSTPPPLSSPASAVAVHPLHPRRPSTSERLRSDDARSKSSSPEHQLSLPAEIEGSTADCRDSYGSSSTTGSSGSKNGTANTSTFTTVGSSSTTTTTSSSTTTTSSSSNSRTMAARVTGTSRTADRHESRSGSEVMLPHSTGVAASSSGSSSNSSYKYILSRGSRGNGDAPEPGTHGKPAAMTAAGAGESAGEVRAAAQVTSANGHLNPTSSSSSPSFWQYGCPPISQAVPPANAFLTAGYPGVVFAAPSLQPFASYQLEHLPASFLHPSLDGQGGAADTASASFFSARAPLQPIPVHSAGMGNAQMAPGIVNAASILSHSLQSLSSSTTVPAHVTQQHGGVHSRFPPADPSHILTPDMMSLPNVSRQSNGVISTVGSGPVDPIEIGAALQSFLHTLGLQDFLDISPKGFLASSLPPSFTLPSVPVLVEQQPRGVIMQHRLHTGAVLQMSVSVPVVGEVHSSVPHQAGQAAKGQNSLLGQSTMLGHGGKDVS